MLTNRLDYIREKMQIVTEAKPLLKLLDSGKAGPETLTRLLQLQARLLIVDDFLKSGRLQ